MGRASALEIGDALLAEALAEPVEETGLAGPGLADDADELSPRLLHLGEEVVELGHLPRSTDEGTARPAPDVEARRAGPEQLVSDLGPGRQRRESEASFE